MYFSPKNVSETIIFVRYTNYKNRNVKSVTILDRLNFSRISALWPFRIGVMINYPGFIKIVGIHIAFMNNTYSNSPSINS